MARLQQLFLVCVTAMTVCLILSTPALAQGGPGSSHVFYTSPAGHVIQLYGYSGNWYHDDPTALSNGPNTMFFGQPMTSFSDSLGYHVFYFACSSPTCPKVDIFQLYYQASSGRWLSQDMTVTAGAPQPAYGLTSFADSLGEHVFYEGVDQHVHQLYGHNNWVDQDLTVLSHASAVPALESPMTSFADSLGEHVFYTGTDHHVHQLYGHNTWIDQDLTSLSGASLNPITQSPLTSFADSYGEHLFYIATDYRVHQLYGHNAWTDQDLMPNAAQLASPGLQSLTSFSNSVGEHVYYLTAFDDAPNYDVMELCGCSGIWGLGDLTQETSGAYPHQAFEGGPVISLTQGSGSGVVQQVPYLGLKTVNQSYADIYVEWWTPRTGWQISDLNVITGAPGSNTNGTNLTGFIQ